MILEPGTQLGDYRIMSRIGKGTYGIVFEAEHVITQRIDALKVMLDGTCTEDDEQRFLREIQVQASLQHPNIAAVYHAFRTSCGLVLVMERVPGEPLRTVLDRGRIPLAEGLRYLLDTLSGLDFAERSGVIHRDIKPENILITPDGTAKLTDFGLAHVMNRSRLTGSGESLGTPAYISPEQIDGLGEVDARSDVYSSGVVLYEIATGQVPFWAENGFAVMRAHRDEKPIPPVKLAPEIGDRINAVILKAMEKDPARRFQSSAEFREALRVAALPVRVPPQSHRIQAHSTGAAALAGFSICSAMLIGGMWGFHHRPPHATAIHQAIPVATPPVVELPKTPEPALPLLALPVAKPAETVVVPSPPREPVRTKKPAHIPVAAKESQPRVTVSPLQIRMEDGALAAPPVVASEPAVARVAPPVSEANPPAVDPPPPAAPATAPPPAASAAEADAEPKKHNIMVRTFDKLFHKKPAAPGETAKPVVKQK